MMESKKRPGSQLSLKEDELIKSLVPDPSELPDVKIIVGFMGRSSREGFWRLYYPPELKVYDEFSEDDVCFQKQIQNDQSPLGMSVVFLRQEAKVMRTSTESSEAQSQFLTGNITSSYSNSVIGGIGGSFNLSSLWTIATTLGCVTAKASCFLCPTSTCKCPINSETSVCLCGGVIKP